MKIKDIFKSDVISWMQEFEDYSDVITKSDISMIKKHIKRDLKDAEEFEDERMVEESARTLEMLKHFSKLGYDEYEVYDTEEMPEEIIDAIHSIKNDYFLVELIVRTREIYDVISGYIYESFRIKLPQKGVLNIAAASPMMLLEHIKNYDTETIILGKSMINYDFHNNVRDINYIFTLIDARLDQITQEFSDFGNNFYNADGTFKKMTLSDANISKKHKYEIERMLKSRLFTKLFEVKTEMIYSYSSFSKTYYTYFYAYLSLFVYLYFTREIFDVVMEGH